MLHNFVASVNRQFIRAVDSVIVQNLVMLKYNLGQLSRILKKFDQND